MLERRRFLSQAVALSVGALALPKVLAQNGCDGLRHPCCPGCKVDHTYSIAATNHVYVHNLVYTKSNPTKTDLLNAATAMINYANARVADGTMAATQKWFLANLNTYYNIGTNGQPLYSAAQNFGNVVPLNVFNSLLGRVTLTEKKTLAAYVQQNGLYNAFMFWATVIQQYANTIGAKYPPPGPTITAALARTIFDAMSAAGLALSIIDPPMGVIVGLGGIAGIAYMDYNGL